VPVVKGGQLAASLFVLNADPRVWTDGEVALVEAVAERTWGAVERVRAEAALRERESRLRLIQAAGGIGSFDWDIVTNTMYRSPEYLQLQGLPEDSPQDTSFTDAWTDRLHPDDRDQVLSWFTADLANPGPFEREYRIVRPDTGEVRWLLNRGRVEADSSGRAVRLLSAQSDITPRKQAEAALRESEERLRVAQEAADIGAFDWDLRTGRAELSERYLAIMGFSSAQEVTRKALVERCHPDDRQRLSAELAAASKGTGLTVSETRIIHPGGEVRWVQSNARTMFDEAGVAVRRAGVMQDITERRLADEALRESEQRFRAAVDAVQGVLWTNNARGEMEGEQPGWAALTGQSYAEYQGHGWSQAVHPDDAASSVEAWGDAVAGRRPFVFEHRVRGADGRYRPFSVRAIPVLKPDGEVGQWVGIHTDISEQRAAEAAIRDLNATLEQKVLDRTEALYVADQRQRAMFGATRQLIGLLDLDGTVLEVNRAALDAVGATLDDVVGQPLWETPWFTGRPSSPTS
jgi:PAS domain S-box-containing protein